MKFLKDFGKTPHVFRDPIYGFIKLNDAELKIIDTPLFQRLRRISQLALTKYVYPSAEHSRFAHSLGVLQAATNIFINIYNNSDKSTFPKKSKDIATYLQILRFAALLHDIGHTPFSHAAETALLNDKIKHEDLSKYITEKYSDISSIIKEQGIDPKIVGNIFIKQSVPEFLTLQNIVTGHFDVDRADYLLRDSHACGVKYGQYDYHRYIQAFLLAKNKEWHIKLCIEEKNIYVIEAFLMARYHYNLQVPFHRTRVGYDIVLKKYISELKEKGRLPSFITTDNTGKNIKELDTDKFELLDDYSIFEHIKKDSKKGNRWAKILMRQGHIVPIFDQIVNNYKINSQHKQILSALEDKNLRENEDFFSYEEKMKVSKLFEEAEDSATALNIIKSGNKMENIIYNSNILSQLVRPIEILRVYVVEKHKEQAIKIAQKILKN